MCPITILLEYKLILISGELLTSGEKKTRQRQTGAEQMETISEQNLRLVSSRDCLGRAQQDSPGKFTHREGGGRGGTTHWNHSTQHIRHTEKKTREGWVSPGFSICRALRSDCLFPSKHFGGESAGNAIGGGACEERNRMALYRQPRQIQTRTFA